MAIINNLTAKESLALGLLRRIVLILMKNNIMIHAAHIPGVDNKLCDALSRHTASAELLKQIYMDDRPKIVPSSLRPHNYRLQPYSYQRLR